MAAASVQHAPGNVLGHVVEPLRQNAKPQKHDVATELYYYKDPGDGTPPLPSYVGSVYEQVYWSRHLTIS